MNVEIITIGDELLLGQVVDTNSAWMGAELAKEGFRVRGITSIGDDADEIKDTIGRLLEKTDIVLVTGGLGPTKDDITLRTLCEFFETKMVFSERIYKNIEAFLAGRPGAMNELNRMQAMVPEKATVISNTVGTAPITWFERDGKILVSMPGVPVEMKTVMNNEIIPRLKQYFRVPSIQHRHIIVGGYSESALAIKLEEWENNLPDFVKLAYLPQIGLMRLRLTASMNDPQELSRVLDAQIEKVKPILGDAILALEDITPEVVVGNLLRQKKMTMATAESCTGGNIAHLITSVSGSSDYYKGSVVAYANEIKHNILGVSESDLNTYGAVSQQVVEQMVRGVQSRFKTDVAVATSGVAGPNGGTPEKPVGMVWIAVAVRDKVVSECFQFGKLRDRNITRATIEALVLLKKELEK
ncbi:CinA family nicotinamide mononucleotide deamidase-related protein [Paludibacter sp.]|uniref:CinA family nicotinamide mononucleotide deamidase-related protein n=1 Tax=Paludibacter sp. TaxID=1898105 RepID=UPI001354C232|nr:CinA family nicotinamide mononucleotide deamidase-related protein [Paludibacter sp.]MTK53956.1 CinA family nicotinamide mononucleotide deamidase-related protein [Paludibacter sp.]